MNTQIELFRNKLRKFLNTKILSQNRLSKLSGVAQSQISDWAGDNCKTGYTQNAKRLENIIDLYLDDSLPIVIRQAILTVWDGKDDSAKAIAKIILSLKPLLSGKNR